MSTPRTSGFPRPLLQPRPRWWWIVCLLLTMTCQVVACAFWNFLQTGRWLEMAPGAMRNAIGTPISETILGALSIFSYPWMLVVFGVVLGIILLIPLVMAALYPLWSALLAAMALVFVALNPIMGIVVAMGCVLVARNRWRNTHPYGALVLGALPTGLLLQLLVFTAADTSLLLPMQRWILAIPFLLAMAVLLLGGLCCLGLAKLRKLRPGAIWPCILLIAMPTAWTFFHQVGTDELHYALLLRGVEGGDVIFPAQPSEQWKQKHAPRSGAPQLATLAQRQLQTRCDALLDRCDAFLGKFPASDRAPAVAWLSAQARSLQLNRATLPQLISPTAAWPVESARPAWETLLRQWPDHPAGALARLQIARLDFQSIATAAKPDPAHLAMAAKANQSLLAARETLIKAIAELDTNTQKQTRMGLFTPHTSLPNLDDYRQALQAVRELLWKIKLNDVLTDPPCAWSMGRLLAANPCALNYLYTLRTLQADPVIKASKLLDNVQMAYAHQHTDLHDRSEAMMLLAKDETTDTAIEATYELGRIALQTSSAPSLPFRLEPSNDYFRKVVGAVDNPWTLQANDWLKQTPSEPTP